MGVSPETHYENAKNELEILDVLIQYRDIAETYRTAASEMKAAGDYKDAPALAKEYLRKAEETEQNGKEQLYVKACDRMQQAHSSIDRKLAIDLFERISGYKDADALAEQCRQKNKKSSQKSGIKNMLVIAGLGILIICAAAFLFSPQRKYNQALALMEQEDFSAAQEILDGLEGYRDSEEKVSLCKEKIAERKRAEGLKNLSKAKVGAEAVFGPYTWKVLEKDDEAMILIAAHSGKVKELTEVAYHENDEDVTWENCSLRPWLNGTFLEDFTEEEKARILLTDVKNEGSNPYGIDGGADTQDYVYLLSAEEAQKYAEEIASINLNWLLRTPGNAKDTVAYVSSDHAVMEYGCPVDWDKFDICPVIRVSVKE